MFGVDEQKLMIFRSINVKSKSIFLVVVAISLLQCSNTSHEHSLFNGLISISIDNNYREKIITHKNETFKHSFEGNGDGYVFELITDYYAIPDSLVESNIDKLKFENNTMSIYYINKTQSPESTVFTIKYKTYSKDTLYTLLSFCFIKNNTLICSQYSSIKQDKTTQADEVFKSMIIE